MSGSTRDRLLDAAEELFAERGFDGTSIRAVTRRAGANPASVHYHFGGKEELLRAVFDRILTPVTRERLALLEAAEAGAPDGRPDVEAVLRAFIAPDLELIRTGGRRGRLVARFLGRAHTEPAAVVQRLIRRQFGEVGRRFERALGRSLPRVPPEEIRRRLHWVVSILTGLLALPPEDPRAADLERPELLTRRLVAFAAAGMGTPAIIAVAD
ncbi:MAG: TetR/AcrR family transcriptional regulator [Gemmatimonadota bacterium]